MKLFIQSHRSHYRKHFEHLKHCNLHYLDIQSLQEKKSTVNIHSTLLFKDLNLDSMWDYKIFPNDILSSFSQWNDEKRRMRKGDIILQEIHFPAYSTLQIHIIMGVQIIDIINEHNRKGFTYQTLEGHLEKGISTFILEEADNALSFSIHTFSKPGNVLTLMLNKVFTSAYQQYSTRKALENFINNIETI